MKLFWKHLMRIPKWESERMETTVKESMQPRKEIIEDKETDQKQRKVWDPRKFQVTTSEKQQHDEAG